MSAISLASLATTVLGTSPLNADGGADKVKAKKKTTEKVTKCCIDASKLRKLKQKIREYARIHNSLIASHKKLRKFAADSAKEMAPRSMDDLPGNGPQRSLSTALGYVKSSGTSFIADSKRANKKIDLAGNRIFKAESLCNLASEAGKCSQKKKLMNQALAELRKAGGDLQSGLDGLRVDNEKHFNRLPEDYRKKLRKTRKWIEAAAGKGANRAIFQKPEGLLKKAKASFSEFSKSMKAGC